MIFLNEPSPATFLFIFVLFNHKFYRKMWASAVIELGSSGQKVSMLTT